LCFAKIALIAIKTHAQKRIEILNQKEMDVCR